MEELINRLKDGEKEEGKEKREKREENRREKRGERKEKEKRRESEERKGKRMRRDNERRRENKKRHHITPVTSDTWASEDKSTPFRAWFIIRVVAASGMLSTDRCVSFLFLSSAMLCRPG